ncbi:histidine kinase/DNA gyrase B/HSP90-like ATPase [Idiomarina fontislapidosi]|uniref:ATP-binding protein n=1 Tax=Idiomarina fontislapidosi TaxID=263723 RepID=A0A432XPA0_9GAMM|nr:ATP-binding protein [Idiomarina fontislapidosi]PYE30601.1 histidine kinase/DNA gyrase B/HSP90-like ATPase [Idiomarina fontislapidosi]RUO50493.1 ATP-binding protein [Idiomarina fontislapidosi]
MGSASEELKEHEIVAKLKEGQKQSTKLRTDDKVLARVTDGIYRFPSSALRELISNAYDADAENVYIDTDVPRFNTMTIRDDGNGMSIDALVNMIHHIGGSAKRSNKGRDLNVTDNSDNTRSLKKKRKLIGKIGIGLFSVAQLTRSFEVITKQQGDDFYSRAKVELFNYSDELEEVDSTSSDRGKSFQTGEVDIWTEKTDNITAHGTDIILKNLKQSAKDQLRSIDRWSQTQNETDPNFESYIDEVSNLDFESDLDILLQSKDTLRKNNSAKAILPDYHVGYLSYDENGLSSYKSELSRNPSLPWTNQTDKNERFKCLYEAILEQTKNAVSPKLGQILDNYLYAIWTLGLSVPLPYIEKHPFEHMESEFEHLYVINNEKSGQAIDIKGKLDPEFNIGDNLGLKSHGEKSKFNVIVDDIKLYRPLKFKDLPESKAKIKKPIMFIGKYAPSLTDKSIKDTGGELEFEAYLMWTPKVSPRDHNGVLVRVHDASGILFDETFMKHQVAEQTIKSQLTAEIFVTKGLDSALNIDRESFNVAHPHYQIIVRWLHSAIRQVVNKYKYLKREINEKASDTAKKKFISEIQNVVKRSFIINNRDPDERSDLIIQNHEASNKETISLIDNETTIDNYVFSKRRLDELLKKYEINSQKKKENVIEKSRAVLNILESYNLLIDLTVSQQEQMLSDIIEVLVVEV